jgi:hypothetical protein
VDASELEVDASLTMSGMTAVDPPDRNQPSGVGSALSER